MIYWYTFDELLGSVRERVLRGDMEVYDVTIKHVNPDKRHRLYTYKWLGHSVVFRYNGRSKILVYNN